MHENFNRQGTIIDISSQWTTRTADIYGNLITATNSDVICDRMSTCMHKYLLIMVALSLAAAPLRATWAMPADTIADSAPHCAQMQDTTQSNDSSNARHTHDVDTVMGEADDECCNDDCYDIGCNTCAHGATAAPNMFTVMKDVPASPLNTTVVYRYSKRSVIPPLRPPTSL